MAAPILFDYWRSSASYRVRIALNLKGVEHRRVAVDLLEGEHRGLAYKAQNPQGFVPMLEVGGLKLTQSLAIIDYLDAAYPEPRLIPPLPAERAHVMALTLIVACDIHPLNNLRVRTYLGRALGQDEEAREEWQRRWIHEGFAALEAMASERAGLFLFGDAPTIVDAFLVPQVYNARRLGMTLDEYPLLKRVDAEANKIEAFAAAAPERVAPERQTA